MCDSHSHDTTSGDPESLFIESLEAEELKRRWPMALRELKALAERVRDIRGANTDALHDSMLKHEKKRLRDALMAALTGDDKPELKRTVVRKMADKIGDYLLWRRESSIPVIHELIVLLPWWISHLPGEMVPKLRDIGLNFILNGGVVPVQRVWEDVLSAKAVYMGHCACRSAGVVDDLYKNGKLFLTVAEKDNRRLLDRFVNRYQDLVSRYGEVPDTDPRYIALAEKLLGLKKQKSADYRLETLFEATYPNWEILPVYETYTPSWIRSMHRNHKAHLLHRELVFELATLMYLARGTIFSSMKLFDTPYTICSCPTPESGGGCTLTNWYYHGMSNTSLLPNEQYHGRRSDASGKVLPCRYFPVRAGKECIGCGCRHEQPEPRGIDDILEQADAASCSAGLGGVDS